jgi:hypothetical protein
MPFLKTSRYANIDTVDVTLVDGSSVQAVKLRRLPQVNGDEYTVKQHDRLDVIAQQRYGAGASYWHIADANTELEAETLTATPGRIINVPES